MGSDIRFIKYPRTETPSTLTEDVVAVFRDVEDQISSLELKTNSLNSDKVLKMVRPGLQNTGLYIEGGEHKGDPLDRPVLFGETGEASATYEVDGYHEKHECILEVEAGRGAQSNAVHRDIIRAMTISDAELLILAVPNLYKRPSTRSEAYDKAKPLIERLYRSNRVNLPFDLVLLGY
jgi:hypothetical protein